MIAEIYNVKEFDFSEDQRAHDPWVGQAHELVVSTIRKNLGEVPINALIVGDTRYYGVGDETGQLLAMSSSVELSETPGHFRFSYFAVQPEHRNNGLGSFLLNHVERIACDQGAHTTEVTVMPDYVPFFEKRGYERSGEKKRGSRIQMLKNHVVSPAA